MITKNPEICVTRNDSALEYLLAERISARKRDASIRADQPRMLGTYKQTKKFDAINQSIYPSIDQSIERTTNQSINRMIALEDTDVYVQSWLKSINFHRTTR